MVEKREFSVRSSDGVHTLSGVVYLPSGERRGLFHVVHGMTEHMGRYDRFLSEMAEEGFIAFGYDHLGHGKTATDEGELGYIAKQKGWELLAGDVALFAEAVKEELGAAHLPYTLMGHSMGSFIVRLAASRFLKPDRLIVMGTAGANPVAGAGLALIGAIKRIKGDRHISSLLERIAFGSYNKRFGGDCPRDPKRWLTTDEAVRQAYYADPFCMFKFTVSAMGDLIRLIKYANAPSWYRSLTASFPVLLVSGEEDPVGNYGKGIKEVERKLQKAGVDVTCKLYSGARHEILNDFTYDAVKADILAFCTRKQGSLREGAVAIGD